MDKGIYCLVFENPGCVVRVGAIGEVTFLSGWHIYIGSALGSGGLKRLTRHISIARNHDRRPKWHVDYLLTSSFFSLDYTVYGVTGNRLECRLANMLNENGVPAFGCSDCSCPSHLLYRQNNPKQEILAAFRKLRLDPIIKTIINPQVQVNI